MNDVRTINAIVSTSFAQNENGEIKKLTETEFTTVTNRSSAAAFYL
jgi:hypothetical protein